MRGYPKAMKAEEVEQHQIEGLLSIHDGAHPHLKFGSASARSFQTILENSWG